MVCESTRRTPLTTNSKAGRRVASDPRLCLSTVGPRFPQPLGGPVTHWASYYAHHAPNGLPRRCFRGIIEDGSHYNFYPSAADPSWRKDGEFAGGRAVAFQVWPAQNPVGCFGTLPPRTTLYLTPSVRPGYCLAYGACSRAASRVECFKPNNQPLGLLHSRVLMGPIGAESDNSQVATTRKPGSRPTFSFT
jgi:hypothetical protein